VPDELLRPQVQHQLPLARRHRPHQQGGRRRPYADHAPDFTSIRKRTPSARSRFRFFSSSAGPRWRRAVAPGSPAPARAPRPAGPAAASRAAGWRTSRSSASSSAPCPGSARAPAPGTLLGSTVSVLAVGPSDWSERYLTCFAGASYVSRSRATGFRAQYRARRSGNARSSSATPTASCTWNPECGHWSIPAACSSSKRSTRTNNRSTARRNASVRRAVSWAGHVMNVPSGRKPPSVTIRRRFADGGSGERR